MATTYYLANNLYLKLTINNFPVDFEGTPLNTLQLNSSGLFYIPMGRLELIDISNQLTDHGVLGDGVQVQIVIGTSPQSNKTYNFRIWSWKKQLVNNQAMYSIVLIYDAMLYLVRSKLNPYVNQSSSQVLANIAQELGLQFDGVSTSDFQTWYPGHRKLGSFATKVAKHGWLTANSILAHAITFDGVLRYKDIGGILKPEYTFKPAGLNDSSGNESSTTIPYFLAEEQSAAGFNNTYSGYGQVQHAVNLLENSSYGVLDKLNFIPSSQTLLMNKDIHDKANSGNRTFPAFLSGNVHPQYFAAEYQNIRGKSMMSLNALVTTFNNLAPIDLLDAVKLNNKGVLTGSAQENRSLHGNYVVWNKTLYVHRTVYYEKFQLIRPGYNVTDSTQVS